jgi:hypothetical protein
MFASIFENAPDKRKVPNPGSTCYFLSYFWQIANKNKWPIFYTSLTQSFADLGFGTITKIRPRPIKHSVLLMMKLGSCLSSHAEQEISYWTWNTRFGRGKEADSIQRLIKAGVNDNLRCRRGEVKSVAEFFREYKLSDYLIPKVANLIELGDGNGAHESR